MLNPEYSIVIPVYNSAPFIRKTVEEVLLVLKENALSAEILLINDGSPDASWEAIKSLAELHEEVKAVNLIRNFGQHNAVMCGFELSSGDYIITMDDDLQNPPLGILALIAKVKSGDFDLIFGKFREKKHSQFRVFGSKLVGYLNYKVFRKPKDITLTNFRIIRSDVIKRVLSYKTLYPYIPGLLLMFASNIGNVSVEHQARSAGTSNYTIRKILSLVARLLINYSSYPLRLLSSIGLFVSILSFLIASIFLVRQFIVGSEVQGWTSLIVLLAFLGGFIIALLGLIGEYLARILDQLSSSQSYIIKEIVG